MYKTFKEYDNNNQKKTALKLEQLLNINIKVFRDLPVSFFQVLI
jgi:hypothetical protein